MVPTTIDKLRELKIRTFAQSMENEFPLSIIGPVVFPGTRIPQPIPYSGCVRAWFWGGAHFGARVPKLGTYALPVNFDARDIARQLVGERHDGSIGGRKGGA